jgi:hypothetical protein
LAALSAYRALVDGNDQLRPGHRGDLLVDTRGRDLERLALADQVPDGLEEDAVRRRVVRLAGAVVVPAVDLLLQPLPLGEQRTVAGSERPYRLGEPVPELRGRHRHSGAGNRLVVHEVEQHRIDPETAHLDIVDNWHLQTSALATMSDHLGDQPAWASTARLRTAAQVATVV